MDEEKKFDCYTCKHRGEVPGDAHISCNHPLNKQVVDNPTAQLFAMFAGVGRAPDLMLAPKALNIKANPTGVRKGWFNYPWNFDPTWLLNCDGWETTT